VIGPRGAPLSRDNRLVILALFLWGIGEGLFLYIEPLALQALGADPIAIGQVLAAAGLAAGVAHIPAGYLADRFGRKPVLVAGWVLGAVASLVMFLARDLRLFVPALIGYTFTSFVVAPINAYVSEARGPQSVQRALTLVSAGFYAGSIVSPALGGFIARTFELRTVFGVATAIFVVSTVVVLRLSPQPRTAPQVGHSRYGALLKNQPFLGFLALIFVALLSMHLGLPLMPNFIVEARGYDVGTVGLLGSAASVGIVLFNLLLGQRPPRRGFMLAQGLLVVALVLLLVTASLPWLMGAYFFRAGWNLARNMAAAQVSRVVQTAELGLALGMTETVGTAATVLSPLAAGLLYARGPALPFQLSLALILLTLPLVWRFAPRHDAHSALAEQGAV
jgi:DHA1 family multidrug resistance protein-like MFS transporter